MADTNTAVSYVNPNLQLNQTYTRGTFLGYQGNRLYKGTGDVITHLHFVVVQSGIAVDPSGLLGHDFSYPSSEFGWLSPVPSQDVCTGVVPPPSNDIPVGSAGGTFQVESITVTVPPGVVPDGSTIYIEPLGERIGPPAGEGLQQLFHLVEITIVGPDGAPITNFATPLQVCFTYTTDDLQTAGGNPNNLVIGTMPSGGSTWQFLPTRANPAAMQVCANVYHLSLFNLFVPQLPGTGFASGVLTTLPQQPAEKAYSGLGSLWLEIPSQGVKAPIVGVPFSDSGWDVSWLSDQIGWLEGTAFPTWAGNSVLTAHVYDANGQPGPFVNLGSLLWGQKIIIHAFGQKYIYEVHSVWWWTKPDDMRPLQHEEYPWLTLITCRGYDEESDTYRWRTVVRAVQVSIEDE